MALLAGSISQKGGVGKSSCARLAAREYARSGWNAKIADLDVAQAGTGDWKKRRDQNAIQPEIAIEPFRVLQLALRVAPNYDLIVFDAPPHASDVTREIARKSDLCLIPTGSSLDDLRSAVLPGHELVDAGIPKEKLEYVLWRVGDRENELAEARAYLEQAGYTVLRGSIPERTAYRRASDAGRALSEVGYPSLRARAEEVAQAIVDRITRQTRRAKQRHGS
jgi:chromosome partitioning protein